MSAPYSQQGILLSTSFRPHTHTHSHTPVLPEGTIVPQAGPRTTAPLTTPYGPPRPAVCRCRWRPACRWAPTAFSTSLLSCITPTPRGCQRYVLLGGCQRCVVLSATAVQQLRHFRLPSLLVDRSGFILYRTQQLCNNNAPSASPPPPRLTARASSCTTRNSCATTPPLFSG